MRKDERGDARRIPVAKNSLGNDGKEARQMGFVPRRYVQQIRQRPDYARMEKELEETLKLLTLEDKKKPDEIYRRDDPPVRQTTKPYAQTKKMSYMDEDEQEFPQFRKRELPPKLRDGPQFSDDQDDFFSIKKMNSAQKPFTRQRNMNNSYRQKNPREQKAEVDFGKTYKPSQPYKNICEKYLKDSAQVDDTQLKLQIRELKRIFSEFNAAATSLKVLSSRTYPSLIFEYRIKGQLRYTHIRQLTKQSDELRRKTELLPSILEQIYKKVPSKYFCLSVFAVEKAREIKLPIEVPTKLKQDFNVMFYFAVDSKRYFISFAYLDPRLKIIEFNSNFIEDCKMKYPQQYQNWKVFNKQVSERKAYEEKNDFKQITQNAMQKGSQSNKPKQVDNESSANEQKYVNKEPYYNKAKQFNDEPYKNVCQKYLKDSSQVNWKNQGLEDEIRRLKKLFLGVHKQATVLRILCSQTYPAVIIEYKAQDQVRHMHIRDFFRECDQIQKSPQLVTCIFERAYKSVPDLYWCLYVFAGEKAKELKINVDLSAASDYLHKNEIMFYYTVESKKQFVCFLFIDPRLRMIEFSSNMITNFAAEYPAEYGAWIDFQKKLVRPEVMEEKAFDLLGNEEIDSDEEGPKQEQVGINTLRSKLDKLLEKDLTELDSLIEKKNNDFNEMTLDNKREALERLGDEIEELSTNRDLFIEARDSIRARFSMKRQFIEGAIKKMIVAEKQLESRLPIVAKKREIFKRLHKDDLLIIEGETGSGKSTQLPQLLCQFYGLFENADVLPVLVTQPRKLATRSLAERVAMEMEEKVGGFVDYCASSDKSVSPKAKIVFKLDRLVLDELTVDETLSKYSCLVIDEAHERTISIDVILGFVKELLRKRKNFKVIVTSASMDIKLFEDYFKELNIKALKVSGRMFPVELIYRGMKEQDSVKSIEKVLDEEIIIGNSSMVSNCKGHVLVFCSGVDEITKLCQIFSAKLNPNVFRVYPLHGRIAPEEQKKVFQATKQFKIIFASRIAETAITIDGVRVVVDPGYDIELFYDQKCKISSMRKQQISQSSAKQRAGRSGRTGDGVCFRLYTQADFKSRKLNKVPEIHNTALDIVVLRLKSLNISDMLNFPYLEKPDKVGIMNSLQLMKMIGCLDEKQNITGVGLLLIRIPIEPFLSRAIVEALIYEKVLTNTIYVSKQIKMSDTEKLKVLQKNGISTVIVQILCMVVNCSSLFYVPEAEQQQGDYVKFNEFSNQDGDFFFLRNIFDKFKGLYRNSKGNQVKKREMNKWIADHYLKFKALRQVIELEQEITKIVKDFPLTTLSINENFDFAKEKIRKCKTFQDVLLSCLTTSFCTNLCRYSGDPKVGYTIISQKKPIQIYGSSNLSLQGINPKWIVCYDLITNKDARLYCKVAHAIDFKFLRETVNPYIWNKYSISKMEEVNPFYKELPFTLPTKIMQQVKFDYYKRDTPQFSFLGVGVSANFMEENNKLIFYILNQQSELWGKYLVLGEKEKKLTEYIEGLRAQFKQFYRHNYIGNIFVHLQSGFVVDKIDFVSTEILFQMYNLFSPELEIFLNDCRHLGHFERIDQKLQAFVSEESNLIELRGYLHNFSEMLKQTNFKWKESLVDKRRKIPQVSILLHFFAAEPRDQSNIFMSYNGNQAEPMLEIIKQGARIAQSPTARALKKLKMKISKNKNGINIFQSNFDEFEIGELLRKGGQQGILFYPFQMPKSIKIFREPDLKESTKSVDLWKREIVDLLQQLQIKKESCLINVWGYNNSNSKNEKGDRHQKSELEKTMKVELHAEIKSFDSGILQKLIENYDGKIGVLGTEKLHVRASFSQILASPNERVINALRQQFRFKIERFKVQFPQMTFELVTRKIRNKTKTLIFSRSPKREDFAKPQRQISELFMPKFIRLQDSEFRFLDKQDRGNEILQNLEAEFQYKIYFGMERHNHCLKLYCDSTVANAKKIEQLLKKQLKLYKFYTESISYRGKNLHKVNEIFHNQVINISSGKRNSQTFFDFQINFKFRQVMVTADINTLEKVKNQIQRLVNAEKGECDICADIMRSPYKLFDCGHDFCWKCLSDHVRMFRNSPNTSSLKCPNSECKQCISVHDVRTLLSEEEFQSICDIKVRLFVGKNPHLYVSCNNCEQIFQKTEVIVQGFIDCQLCGSHYCLKCNQSHRNYNCQDWKNRDSVAAMMKKFSIKQCPKCKTGIQKNGGCNHMHCTKCDTHICWKCGINFSTSRECYDHLAKEQGGIFDPHYVQ